jgi:hypothetical protein
MIAITLESVMPTEALSATVFKKVVTDESTWASVKDIPGIQ